MDLELRAWTEADLGLLLRDDTAEMNQYLGGADGEKIIRDRHERFLRGQREGTVWPFSVWAAGETEWVEVPGAVPAAGSRTAEDDVVRLAALAELAVRYLAGGRGWPW